MSTKCLAKHYLRVIVGLFILDGSFKPGINFSRMICHKVNLFAAIPSWLEWILTVRPVW